jgi:hypothetical protein
LASWLNLVERWFAMLMEKQLRRGVHALPGNWNRQSATISSITTKIQSLSFGTKPLTRSLIPPLDFVEEL